MPDSALLRPLPAPKCEQRFASKKDARGGDAETGNDAEIVRAKLDYERQCYRHADIIARSKLRSLQESVSRTLVALKAQHTGRPNQMVGP